MQEEKKSKEIKVLYSFRFLFFIFIFVHHTFFLNNFKLLNYPEVGVAGFIILSGFLNGYMYKNKFDKIKLKDIFEFVKKRILKFYPLHILLIIIVLPLTDIFNFTEYDQLFDFFKKLLTNLTLTQSWINDRAYFFGFNGVSWFLSVYMFLTLLTIPVLALIKKIKKNKYGKIILLFLALLLFLVTIPIVYYSVKNNVNELFYLYIFPPINLFQYIIGMIVGSLVSSNDNKITLKNRIIFTILEILSIVILIYVIFVFSQNSFTYLYFNKNLNLYLLPLLLLIAIFSKEKGYISLLLSNNWFVYLGKISMYLFLIHQPLIRYFNTGSLNKLFSCLFIFVITIMFAIIIDKYYTLRKIQFKTNN